jgi:signal recognition particle receptor subunit beta
MSADVKASEKVSDPREQPAQVLAIADYLARHENKPLLRFITCGSVDDGKSTLIGRLLYESKQLYDDQLAKLERDSARHGTQGDAIDYALLLDGLAAEREQGITIDVAYRFFGTDRRQFIVADCPGHEQYTRNMATGASTADVAVVLVDARKGLLTQTRRHSYIVALLGIRHIVLAVNKMDLVGYDQQRFEDIAAAYRELAKTLGITHVRAIPISGLAGDNVIARSPATPWYSGPTAARTPRNRRDRARRIGCAVPDAGAVGLPSGPGFPRLCRTDRERPHRRRRRDRVTAVGPACARRDDCGRRRRARDRRSRPVGHDVARPMRSTSAAATCSPAPHPPAPGRRPVRRAVAVDAAMRTADARAPATGSSTGARTVNAQVSDDQAQGRREQRRSTWRRRRLQLNEVATATCR